MLPAHRTRDRFETAKSGFAQEFARLDTNPGAPFRNNEPRLDLKIQFTEHSRAGGSDGEDFLSLQIVDQRLRDHAFFDVAPRQMQNQQIRRRASRCLQRGDRLHRMGRQQLAKGLDERHILDIGEQGYRSL